MKADPKNPIEVYVEEPSRRMINVVEDSRMIWGQIKKREKNRVLPFWEAKSIFLEAASDLLEETAGDYNKGNEKSPHILPKSANWHVHATILKYLPKLNAITIQNLNDVFVEADRELERICGGSYRGSGTEYDGKRSALLFIVAWVRDLEKF